MYTQDCNNSNNKCHLQPFYIYILMVFCTDHMLYCTTDSILKGSGTSVAVIFYGIHVCASKTHCLCITVFII